MWELRATSCGTPMGVRCTMFLFLAFVSVIFSSATGQTLVAESFVVVEGQDFTANCSNPSGTVGISYVVNGDIGGGNYSSRVQSLIGTPQLNRFVFYNVTRTDDGTNFSCSTVNDGGNPFLFGNGTIRVIYPPEISGLNSSDQQVDVGSSFFLSLTVDAKPPVSNFSWTRKRLPYSLNVTSTSISIAAASLNDAGTYSLTVENIVNSTTVSFNLTVLCSPEFQSSSNPIHVNESDSFTISCCISSSCPFSTTITLRYDGQGSPLSSNPLNLSNSNCGQSFSNVQVTFSGNYTCEARNIHNRVATKVYNVSVMHKPGPVGPVAGGAGGATGVAAGAVCICILTCILTCVCCPCCPCCLWCRSKCCCCCPEKYICYGPYRYCDDDSIPIPHVEKQPDKEKEMETGQPSYPESSGMSTGAMYQDPNTIQRQATPTTGDLYAQPDKPARHQQKQQAMELPTYQDPNTIQRQVVPSGDMYALPDKIPKQPSEPAPALYTEVDRTNQTGTMYAELDHTGKPVVTRRPPPQQPQPVYSPVMGTPV